MSRKPILNLDFDGVLHSYTSGWKGASRIPDDPVPGAMEFIIKAMPHFDIHIHSSRSHQWGGRRAMKRWMKKHLIALAGGDFSDTPKWWRDEIAKTSFADPWNAEVEWAASLVLRKISFPRHKPPAHMSIDDRGYQFDGSWPEIEKLLDFKPWNKRNG